MLVFFCVRKWVLPSLQPDGTKNYKNRALRSPFMEVRAKKQKQDFLPFILLKNVWLT
jgi:hypothetical protein